MCVERQDSVGVEL